MPNASGNPVFVLLGGAGGIGSALCRDMVADGLRPVVAGRSVDGLQLLASELGIEHAM